MHEGTHPDHVVAEAHAVFERHVGVVEAFAARLPEMCAERDGAFAAIRQAVGALEDDPDAAADLTDRLLTRTESWDRWYELRRVIDRVMSGSPWDGDMDALRTLAEARDNDVADQPLLMAAGDAARMLGVSENHVRNLVARGELPAVKIGRRTLIARRAVNDLIEDAHAPTRP